MSDIPITKTIALDRCWVCPSDDGLHDHHLVPKSCGGLHGPTVSLCARHHAVIHVEAFHPPHARRFSGDAAQVRKLQYLTQVIYTSFLAVVNVEKPVNKAFKFGIVHQRMWNAYRAMHPHLRSDQAAMEAAIEFLYATQVQPLKRSE